MPSRKILILFAHPALEKSRVNRVLIEAIGDLSDVTVNDLYEEYPHFDILVAREQELLLSHDLFVLHHPFFWYSTPAMLKEWQDLVLTHGWAFGSGGDALYGKIMLNAITTGGHEGTYQKDGYNRFTMQELLRPISQTAHLCGIDYLPPFIAHGSHAMTEPDIHAHARDYRRLLEALRDDTFDIDRARGVARLNADLSNLIAQPGDAG